MIRNFLTFIFISLSLLAASPGHAVDPDEMLDDPALEARARVISKDLRCVVCQNETIDDSNATLAIDMRRLVRQRVLKGDSNDEVITYMVERYGEFVLLRPRFTATTFLLWLGPLIVFVLGAFVVARNMRRTSVASVAQLSDADLKEADSLLSETENGS